MKQKNNYLAAIYESTGLVRELHAHAHAHRLLIYVNFHDLHMFSLLFLSSCDNNFIPIGYSQQCVRCRKTCGVLKNREILNGLI